MSMHPSLRPMCLLLVTVATACSGPVEPGLPDPDRVPVSTVTIEPGPTWLGLGSTHKLKVRLRDVYGRILLDRVIRYTSSDERVVTADTTGLLSAVGVGVTTITATSEGKQDRIHLSVSLDDPCLGCWDYAPPP